MNKNLKNEKVKRRISNANKGITLIALIITIIVLLILAVVAIQAVKGDGILAHAKNAKDEYQKAQTNEATLLEDYEDYITEKTGKSYPKVKVGEEAKTNGTINGKAPSANNPIIPAGFTPINIEENSETGAQSAKWDAEGGPEVDNGLVITDGTSEFVWVPVNMPIGSYGLGTSNDREPDVITGVKPSAEVDSASGNKYDADKENLTKAGLTQDLNSDEEINAADFKIQLTNEFNLMAESIANYKGFYVGRYETSKDENGKVQSARGKISAGDSTNEDDWYVLYKILKDYSTESVQGSMIWGSQYDAMMNWMGNAATITIEGRNTNKTTGTAPADIIKNVYDLYGNSCEWTIEAYSSYGRVMRGGASGQETSPDFRCYHGWCVGYPTYSCGFAYTSSRLTLSVR